MNSRIFGIAIVALSAIISCRFGKNEVQAEELGPSDIFEGHATHFEGMGQPYGGCGVPQEVIGTPFFAALNVQHTPKDYVSHFPRPIPNDNQNGMWDRGRNCGRYIRVELFDTCIDGVNDGAPGGEFCAGGHYSKDDFSGASLDFLIADSCQDGNLWCRDDRFHVDLSTAGLRAFAKNGEILPDLTTRWVNRKIRWKFIDAPNYSGDIKIGFLQDAKLYWPAIAIAQLKRGIHGVEVKINGTWQKASMIGDNGQAYALPPNPEGNFTIRVLDAYDQWVQGGREYSFRFPCDALCSEPFTAVEYTTAEPNGSEKPIAEGPSSRETDLKPSAS